jgi:hypothetical protein
MRTITLWLALLLGVTEAQEIPVMKLTDGKPLTIKIGTKQATILQFPRKITGLLGYGLTDGKEPGSYHYAHPKNSALLSLRNLTPGKEADVGIILGEDLVLLHLKPDANAPAAVRFIESDQRRLKPRKISAAGLQDKQLDYNTEKLLQLLKLARNERVFQAYLPHLYQDAESREAELIYDDGNVASIIRRLYRFPKEDALVLIGAIQNRFDYPIQVDPGSFEVRVGKRVYPAVLVDASEMVPANSSLPVHLIIKGDAEGNRANLAIKNDFRLVHSDYCRYEEPDPEWGGYVDASLFGDSDPSQAQPVTVNQGGQK